MATRTKISNCRFPSSQRRAGSDGIVLIIVMIVATLLLIALTAVLPSVYQEGQRDREEELIFRGREYGKAVALFHRQFGRYPTNIKELLGTNGRRFLRKEYRDPMDPKGKWRFIHVNAGGVLLDSKNQPLGTNSTNPAGLGQNTSTGSMFGGNSSMGNSSFGNSSMGNSNSTGAEGSFGGMGMSPPAGGSSQTGPTSSMFGNPNEIQGAFIAGVAATSHHESIKIWQKHHHYDEWEFLGIDMGIFGIQVGMPGGSSGPAGMGQQSTPQGSGFSQGSFGPTNSPSNFGSPSN
jgi:type II secretory pathway pseudopilin PulG